MLRHAAVLFLLVAPLSIAQNSSVLRELEPRPITLAEKDYDVAEILNQFERQTGSRVLDRRPTDSPRRVKLGFTGQPFWKAVDELATKLGTQASPLSDEGVVLVDGPRDSGAVAYSGIFRAELTAITNKLELGSRQRSCNLDLEIAWEPRFEPLYLSLDHVHGTFAAPKGPEKTIVPKLGRVRQPAERGVSRLAVHLVGPDRSATTLSQLNVTVGFVGPAKMLTFELPSPKAGDVLKKDGVEVNVATLQPGLQQWTLDVLIRNPKETPEFESYQSWLENNRIHFEKTVGGRRLVWTPKGDQIDELTSRHARIRYYFDDAQNRGKPADWTLVVRTPGPIAEFTKSFEFRDVPLP
jgi:hypothetical protein